MQIYILHYTSLIFSSYLIEHKFSLYYICYALLTMYKHTEYPSIRNIKIPTHFRPTCVQEKLDGANVRIIVPKDGRDIILGTRKTLLNEKHDFKNFKKTYLKKLEEFALKNMKPIIDCLKIPYDEFVVYGELVGPSIFFRLNYGIKELDVYFYDLFLYNEGKSISPPWTYKQLQENLERCEFKVIPFQQYTDEMIGDEYTRDLENARSFLNPEEKIEGYILRDEKSRKVFKYKREDFREKESSGKNPFSPPLEPTEDLYQDLENKYGGFVSMSPEKIVSLMLAELIENHYEIKQKRATKSWIWKCCCTCFTKFFPETTISKELIQLTINLL